VPCKALPLAFFQNVDAQGFYFVVVAFDVPISHCLTSRRVIIPLKDGDVMIDKDSVTVLKFIADNQPCSFDDMERKFGADFRYSMQMRFLDKNHFFDVIERTPDNQSLFGLTPEGRAAVEEYGRLSHAERRANAAIVIALLALFKPASIDLFEFTKRLVLSLLKLMQG